jgi:transposase
METILTMSHRERDRLKIITQIHEKQVKVAEAMKLLDLSERTIYRLLHSYREEGDQGLIHKLRGRSSNRGYPKALRQEVVSLFWNQYRDYGPTLLSEVLAEHHRICVHHETIRRWLQANGGGAIQRKKRPHRRMRPRRSGIGELLQFDGSEHDWFEGRGPRYVLLHAIDDASGRIFLRFAPSENTADALRTLRAYCQRFGIPRALYTDHGSVFYAEKKLTDLGRAMTCLGVKLIFANSPQAKGRVERGNRTHQDRLVKELRRLNISTIGEANHFLETKYCEDHNQRFAFGHDLADVHRSIDGFDLDAIFCFQTERRVRNDYTITLDAKYIQLRIGVAPLPLPGNSVSVRRYLDGTLHIFSKDHELLFEFFNHKQHKPRRVPPLPASDHPWRFSHPIGKAKYAR